MAATKDLTAVTLQLEVKNGVDKNDQPKFKDISYENLDTKATVDQLTKTPRADHGRPDPAGRPGCLVRLPHGHRLVPVGTDGRETGEPDPEHRTAAHGSEDGIEISTVLYFIRKNPSATGSFHRPVTSDQKGAVKK